LGFADKEEFFNKTSRGCLAYCSDTDVKKEPPAVNNYFF